MFVTFEGIEGTGKSTQIAMLREYLEAKGRRVLVTLEPGGSRVGRELRKMLLHMEGKDLTGETELFLYLADRAQHVSQVIRPALDQGQAVISDRFADSTVVYQGYGRGLDPKLLHQFNKIAVAGLWPELTILLDIDPELGLKRAMTRNMREGKVKEEGRFEAESLSFHKRVREGYLMWAALNKERFKVVDASPGAQAVFEDIRRVVDERFGT
ncbi:MAG: dTMP kinase [Desulfovibrionaceae bacterium]|nr:dTMP kinase [Desulfovibrionaceae bacterium]